MAWGHLSATAEARAVSLPETRRWKGRGAITVLATAHGDPRVPPGVDAEEAMLLATTLADGRARRFVDGSGVPLAGPDGSPSPGDLVGTLARLRPDLEVTRGSHGEHGEVQALAKVAWGLAPPGNQAFRARRLALAQMPFGLEHPAIEGYRELRGDALVRMEAARQALAAAAVERVAGLPRRGVLVVKALGAASLCELLEASGIGGRLVATEPARTLLDSEELFWAGIGAGLPEPGEEGLMPWARALKPFHEAFQLWPGREAFAQGVAASTVSTPELTGPLREQVQAAAELLAARSLMAWPEGLPIHQAPPGMHAMSYDSFTHRLKVSPVVAELSLPLTAAVLLHELVHVADVAEATAWMGTDPRGFALLVDRLPVGIATGVLCSMEDHAYHREVQAVPNLGLRLPDPEVEPIDNEGRILQMLAMLNDAGPGSSRWLAAVDSFVGIATRASGPTSEG